MTNSERRVQRVRKALDPPGEARDDTWILAELARPARSRLGPPDGGGGLGRAALALADASAGCATTGSRRSTASSGRVPTRSTPGRSSSTRASGPTPSKGRARRSASSRRSRPSRRSTTTTRSGSRRAPARVVQHGRAVEPLPLAAPSRRVARRLARGCRAPRARRGRGRAGLLAARLGRGAGPDRPGAPRRARVHDVPLPGRGRREPAHDRRHRPEVGHGRVQGRRDPGREARAAVAGAQVSDEVGPRTSSSPRRRAVRATERVGASAQGAGPRGRGRRGHRP